MTIETLDRLHKLPRLIEQKKEQVEHLRDLIRLKGSRITGMPHYSGAHDKIGEIMPVIADAEVEITELENELLKLQLEVETWTGSLADIKAAYLISLRYIERYKWDQITEEISNMEGERLSEAAARKYIARYLKEHCE